MTAALELGGVSKTFAGLTAVRPLTFSVAAGSITGLLGPSGSGKTVVLDMIAGQIAPDAGSIRLATMDGASELHEIAGLPAHAVTAMGIGRTWSDVRLIGAPSVLDEIVLGAYALRTTGLLGSILRIGDARREMQQIRERASQLLALVGLAERSRSRGETLSRGERTRVGIARALACEPSLLLLDGPANGLTAEDRDDIVGLIRLLRDAGITVLLADRNMQLISNCCDQVIVLNAGRLIAEGRPSHCFQHPDVQRAYFGAATADIAC